MPGDDLDPFEIKGNLSIVTSSDPLEFGDGSIDADGDINLNGVLGENTIGNGFDIKNLKTMSFKEQTEPVTPETNNKVLYLDSVSKTFKTKNSSGTVLELDTPLTTKGDILSRSSSGISKLGLGADGQVLTVNSSQSLGLEWVNAATGSLDVSIGFIQDQKVIGTNGGTFTSGSWITRDLNTLIENAGGDVSLSSNQITLVSGNYKIYITAPAYFVGSHQIRLRNVTDNTTNLIGTNQDTRSTNARLATQNRSVINGYFEITSSKTFEIQHICTETKSLDGLGRATGFGTEIYTSIIIAKFFTV